MASAVGPAHVASDLSGITFDDGAHLAFQQEAERARSDDLLLVRSSYRQPFGRFSGTLPGGLVVDEAFGVMEEHTAVW